MKLKPLGLAIRALYLAQATVSNLICNYFPPHTKLQVLNIPPTKPVSISLLPPSPGVPFLPLSATYSQSRFSCHLCPLWSPTWGVPTPLPISNLETEALQYLLRCVRALERLIHFAGPPQHEGTTPFWLIFESLTGSNPEPSPRVRFEEFWWTGELLAVG